MTAAVNARIDLSAIEHNTRVLREAAGSAQVMAVVKAEGYGHGLVESARAARAGGATWLGTAVIGEAVRLREAGLRGPILSWLHSPGDRWSEAVKHDIDVSAGARWTLREVEAAALEAGKPARVHLESDSGMGRGGCPPELWRSLVKAALRAQRAGRVRIVGVWSHLAGADQIGGRDVGHGLGGVRGDLLRLGFVVLSPVKRSVARDTKGSPVVLATALSTGLYASHTFVPPAAGPVAAAANMGITGSGLTWLILAALPVSLVSAGAGLYWATRRADRGSGTARPADMAEQPAAEEVPSAGRAVAPLLVPVGLMAAAAVVGLLADGSRAAALLRFLGNPSIALLIGLLTALALLLPERGETTLTGWLGDALADAGPVLMIVGAGGAFGAVITATPLTAYLRSLTAGQP